MAEQKPSYEKLLAFYRAVAQLTFDHDCISYVTNGGEEVDLASVSPAKLGEELEKVDPEWYNNA